MTAADTVQEMQEEYLLTKSLPISSRSSCSDRNTWIDARAVLAGLNRGQACCNEAERRALSLLVGLPRWYNIEIAKRYAGSEHRGSIDESISAILLEVEDEGIGGPVS